MNLINLRQKMQEKNFSLYKLALESKVAYSTLHDLANGKTKNPGVETITKIANALEEKVEKLI